MAKFRIVKKYDDDLYNEICYFPQIKVLGFIWWPMSFGKSTYKDAMDVIKSHVESHKKKKEIPKPEIVWEGEF